MLTKTQYADSTGFKKSVFEEMTEWNKSVLRAMQNPQLS
jgi:hypothetical protein